MLKILIVEDDVVLALDLAHLLEGMGARPVGPAHDMEMGLAMARSETLDLAILDVNLGLDDSTPIADQLRLRGIPFVIATGYRRQDLPPSLQDAPLLCKPVGRHDLEEIVRSETARR